MGQWIKFQKKSKKKFRDIQQMTHIIPKGTSRINLPGTSLGSQIRTSPRRHFETSPGCQIRTSPGWSNWIFRGCHEEVGRGRSRGVLRTDIFRLGFNNCFVWFLSWDFNYICSWSRFLIKKFIQVSNSLWYSLHIRFVRIS